MQVRCNYTYREQMQFKAAEGRCYLSVLLSGNKIKSEKISLSQNVTTNNQL